MPPQRWLSINSLKRRKNWALATELAGVTAILDACVIYPAPMRDLLIRLSQAGLFRARWTHAIHEEWIRNLLINRPDLSRINLERTRDLMVEHIMNSLISGYEEIIPTLDLPDTNDRHVLAAAVHAKADLIVTVNQKDFPESVLANYQIQAVHPDQFVCDLLVQNPELVCGVVRSQRNSLRDPPRTVGEFLKTLSNVGLRNTAIGLQGLVDNL
ncbi:MAG: PIN domain-containing protein [Chthonomonadales bacterium]